MCGSVPIFAIVAKVLEIKVCKSSSQIFTSCYLFPAFFCFIYAGICFISVYCESTM